MTFIFAREVTDCYDSNHGKKYDPGAYVEVDYDDGTSETIHDFCDYGHPKSFYCDTILSGYNIGYFSQTNYDSDCTVIDKASTERVDLVAYDILITPENPKENQKITLKGFIENRGKFYVLPTGLSFDTFPAVSYGPITEIGAGNFILENIPPNYSKGYQVEISYDKAGYYDISFMVENKYDLDNSNNKINKTIFIECADGCFQENNCIPTGYRSDEQQGYCSNSGEMQRYKIGGDECTLNFECRSNSCKSRICHEGFFQKIGYWFRGIFDHNYAVYK
jgi:hypothetical protein